MILAKPGEGCLDGAAVVIKITPSLFRKGVFRFARRSIEKSEEGYLKK
jgi:hypothetical protein